jgi:hypothetical protein
VWFHKFYVTIRIRCKGRAVGQEHQILGRVYWAGEARTSPSCRTRVHDRTTHIHVVNIEQATNYRLNLKHSTHHMWCHFPSLYHPYRISSMDIFEVCPRIHGARAWSTWWHLRWHAGINEKVQTEQGMAFVATLVRLPFSQASPVQCSFRRWLIQPWTGRPAKFDQVIPKGLHERIWPFCGSKGQLFSMRP